MQYQIRACHLQTTWSAVFRVSKMAAKRSASKFNLLAEPDNALVCGICLEVAEEPRQHEKCGKLLCSECLEKYGRKRPCPNCREKKPQYFGDSKSKLA